MALAKVINSNKKSPQEMSQTKEKAEVFLLRELGKAIDDMENGRVQDIESAWKEIDAI